MTAANACQSCRWFRDTHGECRRFPPVVFSRGQEWPAVLPTDWCGEYAYTNRQPDEPAGTEGQG